MKFLSLATMLIFITLANCELDDCSKKELVQIAIKANAALRESKYLPQTVQIPIYIRGIEVHDLSKENELFERKDLIDYIKNLAERESMFNIMVQNAIDDSLLELRKYRVFPVFEIFSYFPKEDLLNFCKDVEDYARDNYTFLGEGLLDNISSESSPKEIAQALKSFAQSRNIPRQELWDLATDKRFKALYEAQIKELDKNLHNLSEDSDSFTLAIEKIQKEDESIFDELEFEETNIEYWEILANSKNRTGKQLVNELRAIGKPSE